MTFRQMIIWSVAAFGCYAIALAQGPCVAAQPPDNSQGVRFFETRVRPLLSEHCYQCHGPEEQESDLRLDTIAGLMQGGASGMTVVAGQPAESLLLAAVGFQNEELQMPPDGRLTDAQIADLKRWIEMGAPHPDADGATPVATHAIDIEQGREFWAFIRPSPGPLPPVQNSSWPTSPIDLYVLAKLEENELQPAPPADKLTLIRRATFDLTGLPPTSPEIEAFLSDDSPLAFATLVNRLLDSPAYGQRWGRHWLDVVRYADSNGLDENIAHGNAWRYRNYVIDALNADKPYDEFVMEQLAGDLIAKLENVIEENVIEEDNSEKGVSISEKDTARRRELLIATGFLSLGPKVLAEGDQQKMEMDIIDEQLDTIGRSLLGLTFGCARCHDHKFDPIGTDDYYGLAGIFKSTRTMEHHNRIARWWENSLATGTERRLLEEHVKVVAEKKDQINQLEAQEKERLTQTNNGTLPENAEDQYSESVQQQLEKLRTELDELTSSAPKVASAMGTTDGEVTELQVHIRGSHLTLGKLVPRRLPLVLAGDQQAPFDASRSGRLRLARWMTDGQNPLTARVLVNRLWRWHFGRGIVASPDNFGQLGERPVNQPLLDYLANRFVEGDWSIKSMHRLIMLSSTYRMSSGYDLHAASVDPENRLQWRANVRRLEAEAIRDALLAVSGTLDPSAGESMLHVENREFFFNHTSKDETSYDSNRRSVYLPVVRNHLYDVFQIFDYADASVSNGDRATSTVAPQALFMLNSDFVRNVYCALAARMLEQTVSDEKQIDRLYLTAYGRPALPHEIDRNLEFLRLATDNLAGSDGSTDGRTRAWELLAHAVLSANEFIYVR